MNEDLGPFWVTAVSDGFIMQTTPEGEVGDEGFVTFQGHRGGPYATFDDAERGLALIKAEDGTKLVIWSDQGHFYASEKLP